MPRVASPLTPLALACGAVGIALLGPACPAHSQPPVTIRTPGLPEPGSTVTTTELVADWSNYQRSGWQKMGRGWYDSAEREFLGAIRAARRTPADVRTRYLAQSYASLSWALVEQGRAAEAEPLARWALEVRRSELGEGSFATAQAINLVATIALGLNKPAEAEAALRPMLAVDPGTSADLRREQARGRSLLGLAFATERRYAQAEAEYERAVALRLALRPRDDATLGDDWNNLAWCQIEQRKLAPARKAMTQALALLEASRGANDPSVARALEGLARVDSDGGDLGAAETKLRRAIGIYEAGGAPTRTQAADALRRLATLFDRMQRPRDAEATRARLAQFADPKAKPTASGDAAPPLTPPSSPRLAPTTPRR